MPAVELQCEPSAERQAEHVRSPQAEPVDEAGEAICVIGQPEVLGWVRRPAVARHVPGHHGELIGELSELPAPLSAIDAEPTVEQDEGRPFPSALIGNAEPRNLDLVPLNWNSLKFPSGVVFTAPVLSVSALLVDEQAAPSATAPAAARNVRRVGCPSMCPPVDHGHTVAFPDRAESTWRSNVRKCLIPGVAGGGEGEQRWRK